MKKLKREFTLLVSLLHGKHSHLIIFLLTIALFVISAAAPNATIGIGK
jgi:hypothetical protein